jgi:hypothetical protein
MGNERFCHVFRARRDKATLPPNQGRKGHFIGHKPKSDDARAKGGHEAVANLSDAKFSAIKLIN